jgi:hypothetical protein
MSVRRIARTARTQRSFRPLLRCLALLAAHLKRMPLRKVPPLPPKRSSKSCHATTDAPPHPDDFVYQRNIAGTEHVDVRLSERDDAMLDAPVVPLVPDGYLAVPLHLVSEPF